MVDERTRLVKHAESMGWTVTPSSAKRVIWRAPNGITYNEPPSGTLPILKARLRKLGLTMPEEAPVAKSSHAAPPAQDDTIVMRISGPRPEKSDASARAELTDLVAARESSLMEHRIAHSMADAVLEKIAPRLNTLEASIPVLQDLVNEVADQLKHFRDSYQDSLPPLRAKVQTLEARPAFDLDQVLAAVKATIGEAQLRFRSELDKQFAELKGEVEGETLQLVEDMEARLVAKIQTTSDAVDPLTALRRRLQ